MKKNAMLKIAAILMVAVLLTTCAISSTFAKYTTSGTSKDDARVAKFGIEVSDTALGMFATEYNNKKVLSTGGKVVAPGTEGSFSLTSQVTGTAEVAVNIATTAEVKLGDGWSVDGAFYCPIEVTVNTTTIKGRDCQTQSEFVDAIVNAIVGNVDGTNFPANTDFTNLSANDDADLKKALDLDVSWKWDFEINASDAEVKAANEKDTKLGIAASKSSEGITIEFIVTRTVNQIN